MATPVIDQSVRYELLDPKQSFIVQAPAGSGKTELLTQRILALLTVVEKPENILAITFTRKAAAEMQNRVISALLLATQNEPEAAHEKYRWKLAKKVLERDRMKSWNLLENASRLNITTIDSLSASLSSALPLLSQTGALPKIVENAMPYYLKAAENCLKGVGDKDGIGPQIIRLLKHKDNQLNQVSQLIAQMLAKRLQWMATVASHSHTLESDQLLEALTRLINEKLQQTYRVFPTDMLSELPGLLNQAASVLRKADKTSKTFIPDLTEVEAIKHPGESDLVLWKAISELFLKAGNKADILTRFNISNGFPKVESSNTDEENQRYKKNKKLVEEIAGYIKQDEELVGLLYQIKKLPTLDELENNQLVLNAVVKILPIAVAHLKLIFSQFNVIDFSELAMTSLEALGHEDMPSDLALALDYRLEHILIDEFQDTSTPQVELIRLLTMGWQEEGDNAGERSMFLVGDPMQSIYRFRDANVSLFMKIREQGIGNIKLHFKQLQVNFRSKGLIVDWVNNQFERVMPNREDLTFSAVSYAQSVAFSQSKEDASVQSWITTDASNNNAQANKVIELIKSHLKENEQNNTQSTLAILGRSRANLAEIIQLLNQHKINYQAVDIDLLSQKTVVKDVVMLAYALVDSYDQVSWAACMRAPWFGLKLDDIRLTFLAESSAPVIERIKLNMPEFSSGSQQRCRRVLPLLEAAIAQKGLKPFRKWLYGTFVSLGALHQLDFESDYDDLIVCLDKLVELQEGGELNDRNLVEEALNQLFAAPNPSADNQVQVMTIHKSKGLEFDTVILPRLDATGGMPEHSLLKWTEVITEQGEALNLLAVSKETGQESDGVYQYITYLDSQKSRYEDQRVLYVAATRAKRHLHLLANVNTNPNTGEIKSPQSGSFLGMLWEGIKDCYTEIAQPLTTDELKQGLFNSRAVKQININRIASIPEQLEEPLTESISNIETGESSAVVESAAAVGRVMHKQLQWLSENYREEYSHPHNWDLLIRAQLENEYWFASQEELTEAVEKVQTGINQMMADPLGFEILTHSQLSQCELKLHKKIDRGGYLTRIVDRTFVKDGVRWIVDYKSSTPLKGESLEVFLEKEKALYLEQITDYFKMFKTMENRQIKAGLYFPLIAHFEVLLEA